MVCRDPSGCFHCHCPDLGNSGVWSRSFHRRRTSASTSARCFSIFSMTAHGVKSPIPLGRCSYKVKITIAPSGKSWQTRLPALHHPLRRLSIAISLFLGEGCTILSPRTSYRRMLQASTLTTLVSPLPAVTITVSRFAMRDPSVKCADSRRDVQSPFQLPILGPLRLHLCPA